MSTARNAILNRLRQAEVQPLPVNDPDYPIWDITDQDTMLTKLVDLLQQNHANVYTLKYAELITTLQSQFDKLGLKRIATGTGGEFHAEITQALAGHTEQVPFDKPLEQWKDQLFNQIDAGITECHGAIAATGTLVVWPTIIQPRTLSLVPPCHIAILKASTLHTNFPLMMQEQGWAKSMPTNLLLISGPSKTADIQQTLAYGAHGPKQLVVLILEDI
ncbi:LutC/YkgG family protein [Oceanisphaera pacifica]|uniref:Lactate utilization protein C n=1 Tax=Oceanisphaera pacifica TaxID=2818389 RepID=A0ABS3NI83_9GAMM|nr:lactate utilization protein C [Oceanisphaera pacifica]MBO1520289.1 lactate utilization protein C [Oceanisphaera pacifica]